MGEIRSIVCNASKEFSELCFEELMRKHPLRGFQFVKPFFDPRLVTTRDNVVESIEYELPAHFPFGAYMPSRIILEARVQMEVAQLYLPSIVPCNDVQAPFPIAYQCANSFG